MSSIVFCCAVFLACTLTFGAAQLAGCTGRCGDGYYRGNSCQCDYGCLRYGECCKDYEQLCTTKGSCKGRCGEGFRRGRMCTCDAECIKYKQCCPDYSDNCPEEDDQADPTSYPQDDPEAGKNVPVFTEGTTQSPTKEPLKTEPYTTETTPEPTETSTIIYTEATSEVTVATTLLPETTSTEMTTSEPPTSATTEEQTTLSPSTAPSETTTETLATISTTQIPETSVSTSAQTETTMQTTTSEPPTSATTEEQTTLSPSTAPSETTTETLATISTTQIPETSVSTSAQTETTMPPTTPEATTLETKPTEPTKPDKPIPEPEMKPGEYQADDSNDANLCSGRPITGVTTLANGTVVVFRGHYFWFLDANRVPGPARDISQVWGVPSPIDTVFTRCNCNGKTYIFKGGKYWRFENDALDSGYPKVVETGFDGLRGPITAALSIPPYRSRREAVYFFKRGGMVQKYSYQSGTSSTCGRKPQFTIHTVQNRRIRQAVLETAINFRTSWRGFPPTITAAVSIPNNQEPEGYKYYVFHGSKSYNVRMDASRPVMETPKHASFIKCPNAT